MVAALFVNISDEPSDGLFNDLKDIAKKYDKWLLTQKTFEQVKQHSLRLGMKEKNFDDITIFYDDSGFGYNIYTIVREVA